MKTLRVTMPQHHADRFIDRIPDSSAHGVNAFL